MRERRQWGPGCAFTPASVSLRSLSVLPAVCPSRVRFHVSVRVHAGSRMSRVGFAQEMGVGVSQLS